MKYWSTSLPLLCVFSHMATAAPLSVRQASSRPFPIDGFVAQGYPQAMDGDSHLSFVEYNITRSTGESSIWCWAWAHVNDLSIGDIPANTPCQADSTVKWSFTRTPDNGFNFTVSWQYTGHGRLVGSWVIPSSQVQWVTDEGDIAVQHYVGPTSFSVDTVDVFGT